MLPSAGPAWGSSRRARALPLPQSVAPSCCAPNPPEATPPPADRRRLRQALSQLLGGGRFVEVAGGFLREGAHDAPHVLLRGGARLGQHLADERGELVACHLLGQVAFLDGNLLGQHVRALLVVAGLDGSVERLPRLLYEPLDHGVDV